MKTKMPLIIAVILVLSTPALTSAQDGARLAESQVFTLYRTGVGLPNLRMHIATFDSSDGQRYNKGNCEIAQELFQNQPGVTVRYWCEPGYFRSKSG